jgi:transglutaminase-like putative cysteine protease
MLALRTSFPKLPRDTRDTLFLLAVIAGVVSPHASHIPVWCSALVALVLVWRGLLAWQQKPLPRTAWRLLVLAAAIAGTWASYRTLLGQEAGVTLVVVLLALKTLELRARRDAFVVFFLGFFVMLTSFFYSQSLLTAAAILLALLGLLTALINSHMPSGNPPLTQSARLALRMMLLGAPIMVVLFVFFPRLSPLWGTPGDATMGRSGLAAKMQVGTMASLALDDSVALRVRFDGEAPPQGQMYFRGPVLSVLQGREWLSLQEGNPFALPARANLSVSGPALSYEVTLEPNQRPWLLTLDATPEPPKLGGDGDRIARMNEELQWRINGTVNDLTRYRAVAYTEFRHGPARMTGDLQFYTRLPEGSNPRTVAWAADLKRESGGQVPLLVDKLLNHLRTGGYVYTLEPGEFGPNTADEFWFDRKQGFCEHIASSFVILLRAAGVPARLVTGYQGGERNQTVGDFWVVRQSDAHAWTEVWMPDRGWVRVDPTGAVSPGRIGSLRRLTAPQGVIASAMGAVVSPTLMQNLRAVWEGINNAWNQRILNYTQSRQFDLMRALGFESPSWEDLGQVLLGFLVAASLVGAAWTRWERSRHDPWFTLLETVRQRLRRAGWAVGAASTPRELAGLLALRAQAEENGYQSLQDWLLRYERLRYAPRAEPKIDKTVLRDLRRELNTLSWPK